MVENTHRGIADSHAALGHAEECDRLYQAWLNDDPTWGWGYIGWSDCYHFGFGNTETDQTKAARIISQALAVADLQGRVDVIDRAIEIYTDIGDEERATALQSELEQLLATDEVPLLEFDKNAFDKIEHDYKQLQVPLDVNQFPVGPVRAEHIGPKSAGGDRVNIQYTQKLLNELKLPVVLPTEQNAFLDWHVEHLLLTE